VFGEMRKKHKSVSIIIIAFFLLGLPLFLEAQDVDSDVISDNISDASSVKTRSVRLPWPMDENVWSYEVLIETEFEGEYMEYLQEFTQEFFVIVSLSPGKYRYRVIPYNFLGNPELEQSSEWRNFEVPDIVPEAVISMESDEKDVQEEEEVIQTVEQESEEPDEPEVFVDIERTARLWTLGVSAGSTFATPWLTISLHGTLAPWKYSFFEIGCDIGFITEIEDAKNYYSLYPFLHYALFLPFKTKGGWYAGIGGGCMIANYIYPKETVSMNIFAADVIIGVNFLNMIDLSYTLRTNFSGVSNKFLAGYTYRFR
jgi:hypothetical protein